MDTFANMRAFSCVAEAGSFTAAAAQLDTTTATSAVSNLEAHLQTRLLNRTTRRIALTEAGKRYLLRCEQILAYVEEGRGRGQCDAHARPAGQLKVHTMTGIGQHFVIDAIARYRRTHPDVTFDLTLANRVLTCSTRGYDVSIVLASELPILAVVPAPGTSTADAAPRRITPRPRAAHRPHTLLNHACLRLVSPVIQLDKWTFNGPEGQESVAITTSLFLVNSADAMKTAITSGMGVGLLPVYAAIEGLRNGTLVRVMPNYRSQELNLYAIYPSRQYLDEDQDVGGIPARLAAGDFGGAPGGTGGV